MKNIPSFLIEWVKSIVKREATRLVGYGSFAATTLAVMLAGRFGLVIPSEFLILIGGAGAWVVVELIRKLVYSEDTTQAIADYAAETGISDIGKPPDGPIPVDTTTPVG